MAQDIVDLCAKLEFLIMCRDARKKHGCKSIAALAERSGIGASQLKTLKNPARNKYERISEEDEANLAKACRFDPEKWSVWRTGTFAKFKERYLRDAKSAQCALPPERRTDIPLVPRYGPQEAGGHRLASLRMEAALSNDSERWPIKLYLYCRAPNGYGVGKGFIDLYTGEAIAPEDEQSFRDPFQLPGHDVTIRRDATTKTRASWVIAANSGVIDDVLPDDPYCVVRSLAPGDRLTVTFSIADKDISGGADYIRRSDGKSLGRDKKAILDRIASLAVLHDDYGYVVLCRHEVTFDDAYAGLRLDGPPGKTGTSDQ